jgi:tetratricopeptide (TPR) repeat protein
MIKFFIAPLYLLSVLYFNAQDKCLNCLELYEQNKFEEIIKIVKPLGQKASVNDLVYLGKSYQSLGDKKNAIKAYETLLLIDDQNVDACIAVSAVFIEVGSYENAKFAAERALKFDKKNVKALYNIGVIYYLTKDLKKFDEHLNKHIQHNETQAEFLYLKAISLLDQEKTEEALATFNDLEKVNPKFNHLSFYQGYCLFKTEKFDAAKEKLIFASSLKNEMTTEAFYYLAHTNIKLENKVDACEAFNNAINLGDMSVIKEADDYCVEKKKKNNFNQNARAIRVKL